MDGLPSPNVQDREVTGPVEASVNWTPSGLTPEVGVPVNPAVTGAGAGIVAVI